MLYEVITPNDLKLKMQGVGKGALSQDNTSGAMDVFEFKEEEEEDKRSRH